MLKPVITQVRRIPGIERTGRLLLDRRYALAREYLRGHGIEIGALDRPLWLPGKARAYYLDRFMPAQLRRHYPELGSRKLYVSLVGDGRSLDCIANGSLDFLVANHVIEHMDDPIGALKIYASRLKTGGRIFMAVPNMQRTFDARRSVTTWEHLLRDHEQGPEGSRLEHFREWVELVEGKSGAEAARRMEELLEMDYSIHFHCWTRAAFEDFIARLQGIGVPLVLRAVQSWRNEEIYILEKR